MESSINIEIHYDDKKEILDGRAHHEVKDESEFSGMFTLENAIRDIDITFRESYSNMIRRRYIMLKGSCPYKQKDVMFPEETIPLFNEISYQPKSNCTNKMITFLRNCICSRYRF